MYGVRRKQQNGTKTIYKENIQHILTTENDSKEHRLSNILNNRETSQKPVFSRGPYHYLSTEKKTGNITASKQSWVSVSPKIYYLVKI